MSKLRDVLEKNFQNEEVDAEELKYKDIILDRLEDEIRQEIILEEAERVVKAEEKERLIGKADVLRNAFWTVVIVGILVGVTGNQVTELISLFKQGLDFCWTILLIIILVAIMYIYFWVEYLNQTMDAIAEFKEKNG